MKKWMFVLVFLIAAGSASSEPLLGTKRPFFDSIFCKFYLCDLTTRTPITSSIERFEYAVTPNENDYHNSIKSVWVIRINGVLTGGGMNMGVQDDFFASSGRNGFVQRFIESLTGARASDDQLDQLQRLTDRSIQSASATGKPTDEVSISVGNAGQRMKLFFRLMPRGSYWDAQFRVSI